MAGIITCYQVITPDSAEYGDVADRGWVVAGGHRISNMNKTWTADELREQDLLFVVEPRADESLVEAFVRELKHAGAYWCSSDPWSFGSWYEADSETDFRTGATTLSFHLEGLTFDQEWQIHTMLREQHVIRR